MQKWIKFINLLKVDFTRAFISKRFIFAVIGIIVLNLIDLKDDIEMLHGVTVCYLFNIRGAVGGFSMLLMFLTALPYGASFAQEYTSSYYKFQMIRTRPFLYSVSKGVVTFIAAMVTYLLGHLLLVLLLGTMLPIFPTDEFQWSVAYNGGGRRFMYLLEGDYRYIYFIVHMFREALENSFLAMIALIASTYSKNKFVIYSAPIIFYYSWHNLYTWLKLPNLLEWHLARPIYLGTKEVTASIPLTGLYYLAWALFAGFWFVRGVRRNVENGSL